MDFDPVQDTQRIFRKILRAASFPGTIVDISSESAGIDIGTELSPSLVGIALTLLDAQVTFCLWPSARACQERLLAQVSDGRPSSPETALYQFVPLGADPGEPLRRASNGSLESPHTGAMIIIEVDRLGAGEALRLEGPGIRGHALLSVTGLAAALLPLRDERCGEYPLGLDLCLVDAAGRLVMLPRTTRVQAGG